MAPTDKPPLLFSRDAGRLRLRRRPREACRRPADRGEQGHAHNPALNDRHFLKGANGAIGTMDMAKMEAMGGYLFASGILLDRNGKALKERPYFETYP
ncbi:MAG: hypothetical protein EOQ54_21180 [Mesorhizobium sp.]|uniref:hypothetical protein n=1 Tax=unclassified Mesorhizobium TaxID=325217 RepID=UPI0007FF1970|nr:MULTISPECIES: hypothetical protein [unclassified Mesorhizobium]MDG4910112.1 hypothetical protein [Mesorhizobium sp. WSM4898]OBQ95877.1 hypothetical protein A9K66_23755 [Mesorhizobium sp. AA23]RWG02145.1 MAG: hypothetical protein EOQ54_21180 [Mesorhizobium sp.]RWH00013.1 MAG: hypothetical protein EOQ72_11500 [Mesorhizobium sp.]TIR90942.1 MAG: hypothetical protein E5X08_21260 [Mesorhizobium sp.]